MLPTRACAGVADAQGLLAACPEPPASLSPKHRGASWMGQLKAWQSELESKGTTLQRP